MKVKDFDAIPDEYAIFFLKNGRSVVGKVLTKGWPMYRLEYTGVDCTPTQANSTWLVKAQISEIELIDEMQYHLMKEEQ